MSRQRGYLFTEGRRLRNDKHLFQASDLEIQSDLKKMKYVKVADPVDHSVIVRIPKKRKNPVVDDKFVIEGLVKLMKSTASEVIQKKSEPLQKKNEPVEKKTESPAKLPLHSQALASFFAMQNHILRNNLYITQYNYLPYPQTIKVTSSANMNTLIARYINSHKLHADTNA
jgi:hypothetical protein